MRPILFLSSILIYSLLWGCDKTQLVKALDAQVADSTANPNNIVVSNTVKQPIALGIDAERLWHWRGYLKDQMAQLAVGEMNTAYIRVAINIAYEREEGVINVSAYDNILEMMNAMKAERSTIKFFASPQPLQEAYTDAEKDSIWGGSVPWSPYPAWIQEWVHNGTKWVKKANGFHVDKLTQYYADYLNFMKDEGFDIAYLDLSNEQTIIQPSHAKYIKDHLPTLLDAGVNMPLLIAPSTYSVQGGINWLDSVDAANGEQDGFDIASIHNTGGSGSLSEFASSAATWGKAAWNTEMHAWTGDSLGAEVMNSAILWEHLRSGFVGLDTWLFFGPLGGTGHWMIGAHWNNGQVLKTVKYEIFKQVVNNANGGNYVEVSSPDEDLITAAFLKDNVLSVWVLNTGSAEITDQVIDLDGRNIAGKTIEVINWHGGLTYDNNEQAGESSSFVAADPDHFTYDLDGESLHFFKIDLN